MCLLLGSPPASSPQAGRPDEQGMQEDRYFHQTIRTPAFDPSTRVQLFATGGANPLVCAAFRAEKDRDRSGDGIELRELANIRETPLKHQRREHAIGIALGIGVTIELLEGRPEQLAHQP